MRRADDVSLRRYNSFGVEARAREVVQLDSLSDLEGLNFDPACDLVLGGGSNLLLANDIEGTVFLNRIRGMRILSDRDGIATVEAAAGEIWHSLVLWSLAHGLTGLENLSLIPGLAGAAPLQNIGAYGVELSDVLESVQAWDWQSRERVEFSNTDCQFGYRDSRFKSGDAGRYLVTALRLRLSRQFEPRLTYSGLGEQLAKMEISSPTARQVSQAVIMLRKRKLPDPALVGNAGSFFKNPLVTCEAADSLRSRFPDLPLFAVEGRHCKLGAGWMIEHCGWKGFREGDAGVSERHALVLVNHGHASGREILALADKVSESVFETFGIRLETEPRIVDR